MSVEQIPCSTATFERFEYSGQRDLDPNQVECFLTSPTEAQEDIQFESRNKLSCQICKLSFEGSISSHRLLEHINSIHSFNIYDEGETCHGCDAVFYTSKAITMHKMTCDNASKSKNIRCNIMLDSERNTEQVIEFKADPKASDQPIELNLEKCGDSTIKESSAVFEDMPNRSFKCYICSNVFPRIKDFRSHITSSHKNELNDKDFDDLSYRCKKCATTFPNIILLRGHFFKKHTTLMIYRCIVCHIIVKTKKSLRIHYNNFHAHKTKELRSCDECGKDLANLRALKAHTRLKHGKSNNKQGFRCRLCQEKFDTKENRKLHYEEKHLGESPFICTDCGKGFSSKSGLYGHRQLHKTDQPSTCPYCEKTFNRRDSYHEHILIHVGPRHRCPHCPKEFVQRSNLVRHIRIHTGQKPYTCTYCDKRFSDKGACNSHIRVHTKEEQCACPYCGQTFTKKQKLKYHIRKHTGEGLISCEICAKTFTNAFALKEHRAIHDRQTQTICVECGKAFNSAKYLQRHIALVHQDPQDSSVTLKCPICEKTFCHRTRLKSHIITHLGKKHLQCLICEKRYSSTKSIRNHLKHTHALRPDQPEFKKSVYSAFESSKILNSIQLTRDLSTPEMIAKDTVVTFLFKKETSVSKSAEESIENDKWKGEFCNKESITCSSNDAKIVSVIKKEICYDHFEAATSNDRKTDIDHPLSIDTEDNLNYKKTTHVANANFEAKSVIEEKPTKFNNVCSLNQQLNPKQQVEASLSAIMENIIKVKEEGNEYESSNKCMKKILPYSEDIACFQVLKNESRLNLESSKEINRRRKQLKTPKKYVSPIETLGTADNKLKNVMPKKERVEAIARSLKKSNNVTEMFIEQSNT